MNDLAEQALRGLDAARREVRDHAMIALGTSGAIVAVVIVIAGGRTGTGRDTRPLTSWLHTEIVHGVPAHTDLPALTLFVALVALVGLWVLTVEVVRRTGRSERQVWWVAAAWAVPFAVGPPLLDSGVYATVAFGRLQRTGHDPYVSPPSRLGDSAIVAAIDPGSRGTPSAAGPLGTTLAHLSLTVAGGTLLGAVVVLRVITMIAAVSACRSVAELAGDGGAQALSLSALNPLLLLYGVSAPHLEVVMLALALAAALAARHRMWMRAVALAALAGCVVPQGLVAVPVVIAAHVLGRRGQYIWRRVARDVGVAVLIVALARLVQPDGFGWLRTVHEQFAQQTPFSVTGAIEKLLAPIVRGASYDDLAAGAWVTAALAAACVLGYLVATAAQRSVDAGIGAALLTCALLAPALHPWYLLWGTLALVPSMYAARREWLLAFGAAGCVLEPPGFGARTADLLTGTALLVIALAVAVPYYRRWQVSAEGSPAVPRGPAPS